MNASLRQFFALLACVAATLVCSCAPPAADSQNGKPVIVTTTTMATDLVRTLAGNDFTVEPLMGPGVDPHLFKPGQDDIQRLQKADVIIYSGFHLEGKIAEILERLAGQGRKVHALADALAGSDVIEADGQPDPHIWGDASLWNKCLAHCAQKLSEAYPDKAAAIGARAAAAALVLTETHARLQAAANSLPEEKRVLVTSHDAFRYFGRAYGFEVIGVQGISTVSEAALADMARIIDLVKQRGVKAIFVETSVAKSTIERISKDTGAKIGGELFSDALGTPGELRDVGGRKVDPGTVAGMLESNMHTVVEALK
jgi:manganese/zinc/iron transport system substrate-binding protein